MALSMRRVVPLVGALVLIAVMLTPTPASAGDYGFLTKVPAMLELAEDAPDGSSILPIVSSGDSSDMLGGHSGHSFTFQGLPDGIGITRGYTHDTVHVFVAHEETTVPFFGTADFQNASVSKLTIHRKTGRVLHAEVSLPAGENLLRLCSAYMTRPGDNVGRPIFFVNEETNDWINRETGEGIPDPDWKALTEKPEGFEQAGLAAAHDPKTGETTLLYSMGRLNHENTVAMPIYGRPVFLTTDDTFSATTSQLYLFQTKNRRKLLNDKGRLFAFQVTRTDDGRVDPYDSFNDANDYLDIQPGDDWKGRFIRVPKEIARGDQDALEEWSNENNVFQFIRLEDAAVDRNFKNVVYVADTGASRVVADPATGRMIRGPSGTIGEADNGRIFKFVFNERFPRFVKSFSVLGDGDAPGSDAYVPMVSPDNMDTSPRSLMVQEDADNARVWRLNLLTGEWTVVANVLDPGGESSGIVWAARWFGKGAWMLDVQAHDFPWVKEQVIGDVTYKQEAGQLLLLRLPGT